MGFGYVKNAGVERVLIGRARRQRVLRSKDGRLQAADEAAFLIYGMTLQGSVEKNEAEPEG